MSKSINKIYMFIILSFFSISVLGAIKDQLTSSMQAENVPVVAYAIIDDFQIKDSDIVSIDKNIKVSKDSIFQAASISKSLSAYAALKLVSEGKLDLDEPVNDKLTSWKIPENEYNKNNPVTLRQILDMTSGLSISGFPGYAQGDPLPTLKQILNGEPPANNKPIVVEYEPGSKYFYSGGSFQVLQQLIEDVTDKDFASFMQQTILGPLNMYRSVFQYPLNDKNNKNVIVAFDADGKEISAGWNNYAISASGGLWSTPSDIAEVLISISNAYVDNPEPFIPNKLAKEMLTRQPNSSYGLGVVINGEDRNLNFRKAGYNLGYHSQFIMFPNQGKGVVIMTNSENGRAVIDPFIASVLGQYGWPCYLPEFDELQMIAADAC
jgi:CubicO group peptidase (beta-lactamase class C family)